MYHFQFGWLMSFSRLFRGKRKYILKKRIDNYDYELDQLLLGTILFKIVRFLFPTTIIYHFLFLVVHLFLNTINALIKIILKCLNHFPVFSLVLCLLNPNHLSNGAEIEIRAFPTDFRIIPGHYFFIKPKRMHLSDIFNRFLLMLNPLPSSDRIFNTCKVTILGK